jgi:hypothetical protein
MTPQEAKLKGYTHYGCMYGVPIYMTDDEDMNVTGVNWWNDHKLKLFIWLEQVFNINEAFPILKGPKL